MKKAWAVGLVIVVVAALVRMHESTHEEFVVGPPPSEATAREVPALPPRVRDEPEPTSVVESATDAEVPALRDEPLAAAPSRFDWSQLEYDATGASLGMARAKRFQRTVSAVNRSELRRCVEGIPGGAKNESFDLELRVESETRGYRIVSAQVVGDAGLDLTSRRCFELAMESFLELDDPELKPGTRYRLGYPIRLVAKE